VLEVNYAHIEQEVRETLLRAERKIAPGKRDLSAGSMHDGTVFTAYIYI